MDDPPDHHCPGCGTALTYSARYPWHFCGECVVLAEDGAGRRLSFYQPGLSGFAWAYMDENEGRAASGVCCFIHRREVLVGEARFGGIVVQPINRAQQRRAVRNGAVDLTGPERLLSKPEST